MSAHRRNNEGVKSEMEKLQKADTQRQVVSDFLEWLAEQKVRLCSVHEHSEGCYDNGERLCGVANGSLIPLFEREEQICFRYLGVDSNALDKERRELLTTLREAEVRAQDQDRDPRTDPRPGDVLEKKYQGQYFESRSSIERTVDEVYDDCVTQPCPRNRRVVYTGDNVCAPDITIRAWRKWAKGAKVIRRAE